MDISRLWNCCSRNLEVDSSRYGCGSDVCWLWNSCSQKHTTIGCWYWYHYRHSGTRPITYNGIPQMALVLSIAINLRHGRRVNQACSGHVGVCGVFKHFSGFEFFLPLNINHACLAASRHLASFGYHVCKGRCGISHRWIVSPRDELHPTALFLIPGWSLSDDCMSPPGERSLIYSQPVPGSISIT